jgi:hypothetical protein
MLRHGVSRGLSGTGCDLELLGNREIYQHFSLSVYKLIGGWDLSSVKEIPTKTII